MTAPAPRPGAGIVIDRRVEWPDTDASGHYHHSTILRWIEAAEAETYERVGLVYLFGVIPRVRLEVNHRSRLWFRDLVQVRLWIQRLGRSSVTFGFEIHRGDELAADGSITAVHIDPAAGRARAWPEAVRAALTPTSDGCDTTHL